MEAELKEELFAHFEGAKELQEYYLNLDEEMNTICNEYDFHCKSGCGSCCLGTAENKEASVFEMIPLAIDLIDKGLDEEYLEKLNSVDDCSKLTCVCYVNLDESKCNGYCGQHVLRPFVCRMFGDSIYHVKDERYEFTGCPYLKERLNACGHRAELETRLPKISETVLRGRALNGESYVSITDVNTALRDALQLVKTKLYYLQGF